MSFVSGLGQFAEALANRSPTLRVVADWASDVFKDGFQGTERPSASKVELTAQKSLEAFLASADKRLSGARADELSGLETRLKVELEAKVRLWEMARAAMVTMDDQHGDRTTTREPLNVDAWLGRLAAGIQQHIPSTRPPASSSSVSSSAAAAGQVSAARVERIRSAYDLLPSSATQAGTSGGSGAAVLAGTLARGASSAHRGFVRGVRLAIVAFAVALVVIGLSVWEGWSLGITVGAIALVLVPVLIVWRWPTISAMVVGVSWWRWTPSASRFWKVLAGCFGILVVFLLLRPWWPQFMGEATGPAGGDLWWQTMVLGVVALLLFIGAGGGSFFRAIALLVFGAALAAGVLLVLFWFVGTRVDARSNARSATSSTAAQVVVYTESHLLVHNQAARLPHENMDITLTVPPGTAGCVRRKESGVARFWNEAPVGGPLKVSPNCRGAGPWVTEFPDGRGVRYGKSLLEGIAFWNTGSRSVTVVVRSRSRSGP